MERGSSRKEGPEHHSLLHALLHPITQQCRCQKHYQDVAVLKRGESATLLKCAEFEKAFTRYFYWAMFSPGLSFPLGFISCLHTLGASYQ